MYTFLFHQCYFCVVRIQMHFYSPIVLILFGCVLKIFKLSLILDLLSMQSMHCIWLAGIHLNSLCRNDSRIVLYCWTKTWLVVGLQTKQTTAVGMIDITTNCCSCVIFGTIILPQPNNKRRVFTREYLNYEKFFISIIPIYMRFDCSGEESLRKVFKWEKSYMKERIRGSKAKISMVSQEFWWVRLEKKGTFVAKDVVNKFENSSFSISCLSCFHLLAR